MTPCDPRMFEQSKASEFRRNQRVIVVLEYRAFYTLVGGFCSLFGSKKEEESYLLRERIVTGYFFEPEPQSRWPIVSGMKGPILLPTDTKDRPGQKSAGHSAVLNK